MKKLMPFWIMLAGVVLCCAARVFMIFATDMNTGFIIHGKGVLCNILFYGAVILTAVGVAITARKDEGEGYFVDGKSNVIGFATLILALGVAYEGIQELNSVTQIMFLTVVDFIFALAFVIIAFLTLYRKGINAGIGFSYAFAGIYFTIRGVCVFNTRMVITTIPEYLLDMLGIILGAVFFIVLSKFLTGNGGTGKVVCFWGAASAAIGISPAVGAVIAKLFGTAEISERITFGYDTAEMFLQAHKGDNGYMLSGFYLVNVLFGVFAAVVVGVLVCGKRAEIPVAEENISSDDGEENPQ